MFKIKRSNLIAVLLGFVGLTVAMIESSEAWTRSTWRGRPIYDYGSSGGMNPLLQPNYYAVPEYNSYYHGYGGVDIYRNYGIYNGYGGRIGNVYENYDNYSSPYGGWSLYNRSFYR